MQSSKWCSQVGSSQSGEYPASITAIQSPRRSPDFRFIGMCSETEGEVHLNERIHFLHSEKSSAQARLLTCDAYGRSGACRSSCTTVEFGYSRRTRTKTLKAKKNYDLPPRRTTPQCTQLAHRRRPQEHFRP